MRMQPAPRRVPVQDLQPGPLPLRLALVPRPEQLHDPVPGHRQLIGAVHREPEAAEGASVLSGPEALDHGPGNSFELRWAGPGDLDALNLHPPRIRHQLTRLLYSPAR